MKQGIFTPLATATAAITICAADRHNIPPPLQVDNMFVFIRQVAPLPSRGLFKTSATS